MWCVQAATRAVYKSIIELQGVQITKQSKAGDLFHTNTHKHRTFLCFFLFIQISQVCPAGTISGLSHSYSAINLLV